MQPCLDCCNKRQGCLVSGSREIHVTITGPLLYNLSRSSLIPRMIGKSAWAWRAASRFVAGETIGQAMDVTRRLNNEGLGIVLNFLGEHTHSVADARRATNEYLAALDAIHEQGADAYLSAKLSQIGLDVDPILCREHLKELLERAESHGLLVRIDMESSAYTDQTLKALDEVRRMHRNVGVVIQANLRRSGADIEKLIAVGANIRLVKGAYLEPPSVAYEATADVDASYLRLLDRLLSDEARKREVKVAVATHDERIIDWTRQEMVMRGIPQVGVDFEMLYGIRRDLQRRLSSAGYRVGVYVPYGSQWYAYLMRRLAERPANMLFVLRNILRD
jgi:proline dehydrogenase